MSPIEQLLQAALTAPPDRQEAALRVLLGQVQVADGRTEVGAKEPYLTQAALARKLGVSICTVWRWQPPYHDLGGHRRYRISEVEQYLAGDEFKRRTARLRAERTQKSSSWATAASPETPGRRATLLTSARMQP
jgi:hypothetical protein